MQWLDMARTAFDLRDWLAVEQATGHLLARNPDDAQAMIWRSAACQARNDFATGERLLHDAMQRVPQPQHPVILNWLALCMKEQARFGEAQALLREALHIAPQNAYARFNLSDLELRAGDYAQGWADYEARFDLNLELNGADAALASVGAPWRGESLAGRTLVVYGEQGNGDCLWAFRFLFILAARAQREGGRVILGYAGPMQSLFARALPPGVSIETRFNTRPDFHCGLMSLPLRLGVFETAGTPYLHADAARVAAWRERVIAHTQAGERPVGLVWNGHPKHARDARRSLPDALLGELLDVRGITFFVLSPGRSEAVQAWRARGAHLVDLTPQFDMDSGFDDVAALISCVDHVVTIDSGPAHLAGALGVPTSLLLDHVSSWCWGHETARTCWYDSIELHRQPTPGDWAPVLASVHARLARLVQPVQEKGRG
jgi:tetratricopeptide (TPR) repeat protein